MIELKNATKRFGRISALDSLSVSIDRGHIYGLVGTNGSGKSTMLRLISGVYRTDGGEVMMDNSPIFENPEAKSRVYFVPDDLYFFPQATLDSMARFCRAAYPRWSEERYQWLCELFPIGNRVKLSDFSKGMRRQAALILAMSSCPEYLLLDEAFDGLDPVIRYAVRKLLADMMAENDLTVIISSHNLRELEDFCDKVGLLHRGKLLHEFNTDDIKTGFCKIQAVFKPMPAEIIPEGVRVLSCEKNGSVATLVCAADDKTSLDAVGKLSPILCEAVGLTLEEVFIYEMEAVGYDYSKIIF